MPAAMSNEMKGTCFVIMGIERKRQEAARRPRLVSEMTIATLYGVIVSLNRL